MFIMAIFWIALLFVLFQVFVHLTPDRQKTATEDTITALGKRYSSGEISEAEFEHAVRAAGWR